jgi:hypothetical protein
MHALLALRGCRRSCRMVVVYVLALCSALHMRMHAL